MARSLFKISLIIFAVLAVPMMLIRAQSYDDGNLRVMLTPPEGCMSPCFMGIQPGSTTSNQAIKLLQDSEWVEWVGVNQTSYGTPDNLNWRWGANVPRPFVPGQGGTIDFEEGDVPGFLYVTKITMNTSLQVGDAYLLLGEPNRLISNAANGASGAYVGVIYLDQLLSVWSVAPCPLSKMVFWQAPMILDFNNILAKQILTKIVTTDFYC